MASITLKNLPDDFLRELRESAKANRRSLTQEIIHLLERGLRHREGERARQASEVDAQVAAWRKLAGRWQSDIDFPTEVDRILGARTGGREVDY
jgi:plasmid stability protein